MANNKTRLNSLAFLQSVSGFVIYFLLSLNGLDVTHSTKYWTLLCFSHQLLATLWQPRANHSNSDWSLPTPTTSTSPVDSPLTIPQSFGISLQAENLPVAQLD